MGLVLFVVLFWVSLWLLLCVGLLCVGLSCVDVLPPPRFGPLTKCNRSLEKFSAVLGEDDVVVVVSSTFRTDIRRSNHLVVPFMESLLHRRDLGLQRVPIHC